MCVLEFVGWNFKWVKVVGFGVGIGYVIIFYEFVWVLVCVFWISNLEVE